MLIRRICSELRGHCSPLGVPRGHLLPAASSSKVPPLSSFPVHRTFVTEISGYPFDPVKREIPSTEPRTHTMVDIIKRAAEAHPDSSVMAILNKSGIVPDTSLVHSTIWALRQNWRLAVLGFMWGEKLNRTDEDSRDLIVWILGSHKKFNTAWMMIREWQRSSSNVRRQMLTMIDRYAAANVPERATWTFKLMEKFRASPDDEAYQFLLSSLCNHGFIEEAEEFMLLNKNLFPLNVNCFNILLNAWCNLNVDVLEAKRIWRQMSRYCIAPDSTSVTHMISCFSKVGNLFDSLKFYDGMKRRRWVFSVDVYNSLVYVLTREGCLGEALKMLERSKEEQWEPTCGTYNSMISALCERRRVNEARVVLKIMKEKGVEADVDTFCCFLGAVSFEEVRLAFEEMKGVKWEIGSKLGVQILLKLFEMKRIEDALRVWGEMKSVGFVFDEVHYRLMVEQLVKCGRVNVARDFVDEMKVWGFYCDFRFDKVLGNFRGEILL